MAAIDDFAQLLFNEAKTFLEKGKDAPTLEAQTAFFHAALLLGFSSLEAHLNAIADEFLLTRPELSLLDQSILSEKAVQLEEGEYRLTNGLKMFRLEERIEYLSRKFGGKRIEKGASYWTDLKIAIDLRNQLSHPKQPPIVDAAIVECALSAILELMNLLYKDIYKGKGYPGYRRGLDASMEF